MHHGIVKTALLSFAMVVVLLGTAARGDDSRTTALKEINASLTAMGGEATLRSVHSLQISAVGHRNMLEQSLRPDGPWWQDYFQLTETRDFLGQRERVTSLHRGYSSPQWWLRHESWDGDPYYPTFVVANGAVAKVSDGKFSRFSSSHLQDAEEEIGRASCWVRV